MAEEKSLARSSLFNLVYQLLSLIFPLLTAVYVSRILQAEGMGKVAAAQNLASYFTAIAPLGLASYGVREIAGTRNDPVACSRCFSELFGINALSTLAVSALYYGAVLRLESFAQERTLYLVCGLPILLNLIQADWFYQGVEEYGCIALRSVVTKILALLALFALVRTAEDYVLYALISAAASGAGRLLGLFSLRRFVRPCCRGLHFRRHLRPVLVLACNLLLSSIYSKLDITMLGRLQSDAAVGYYSSAFKIVNIILGLCTAMAEVLLPRLSYCYSHDRAEYRALLNRGLGLLLAIVCPAAVGLGLLAPALIPLLFGPSFEPAARTVRLLAPLIVIKGVGSLACYQVAVSSGRERMQTGAYLLGCLTNVGLNALLIPRLAQDGAAAASVAAELLLNSVLFCRLRGVSGVRLCGRTLAGVGACCALMGAAAELALRLVPGRLTAVGAAIAAGVLVYAAAGYALGSPLVRTAVEWMHRKGG